ncbi:MAG: coproporphyrinogen dehydrogenase HemZ [Sporomusaceae bacterium]|nr:coproporphyrinogen dehydrogenase HemZ [Sporomusaceae bacterium]
MTPWGILRGVRPGKIVARLLDAGWEKLDILKILSEKYGIEQDRAQILTDISLAQHTYFQELARQDGWEKNVSIYIGIPYCLSKCLYCSFPSAILPSKGEELAIFLKTLKMDIEAAARFVAANHLKVHSLYLGGGTPTSLNSEKFAQLLKVTTENFRHYQEFTVEAGRPDSIDTAKAAAMRQFGVTRVSVNPQTFNEATLARIGRHHTPAQTVEAFQKIRRSGIPVINMDVIAALPGETAQDMADTMANIEKLAPENVTVHTLAVKRGSLLKDFLQETDNPAQTLNLPDAGTVREMLAVAASSAAKMQLAPYYLYRQKYSAGNFENTGYAQTGTACLYNMQIIAERQTVIGIGPSAATKVVDPNDKSLVSCYNPKDIPTYLKNLPQFLQRRETLLAKLYKEK